MLLIVLVLMVLSLPVNAKDAGPSPEDNQNTHVNQLSTGLQTWILHSKLVSSGYLMDQNNNPANNGPVQKVLIDSGSSALWIADTTVVGDTEYSKGYWFIDIFTASDWGSHGTSCRIDTGIWNGTVFTKLP